MLPMPLHVPKRQRGRGNACTRVHTRAHARVGKDKHSPTRRKDSTVPSSYSVQQLQVLSFCSPLSLLLSRCLAFSPSLRACVTSPARSLLSVSPIQNLPLSAPARSVCHANPSLPPPSPRLRHLLLLRWLSAFLSLVCLLSFLRSPTHCFSFLLPLTPFFPATPAFWFAAIPLPAHLLCLLSHPDSLKPPPTSRFCHTCKLSPPLCLSLSLSALFLHVGELTGPAGTTGKGREDISLFLYFSLSLRHAPCYINVLAFFFMAF